MLASRMCQLCNFDQSYIVYEGSIRSGLPGTTTNGYKILECHHCKIQYLDPQPENPLQKYEDGSYRKDYDGAENLSSYRQKHDKDQSLKISLIGTEKLRDIAIADVGCGAGAFLDLVKGMALRTIAVEPMLSYHDYLSKNFTACYRSTSEFSKNELNTVDIITTFAVIEHVQNPLVFLKELRVALKPGGYLCLTTPNRREILMTTNEVSFKPHFYRTAHLWYFDRESLINLAEQAGFKVKSFHTFHTYNFSNYVVWLRDRKVSGKDSIFKEFTSEIDDAWRSFLERNELADQIYMELI